MQGQLIFNEGRNFLLNYVSPLKIRCFFGFAAMPRRGIGGFFRRTDRADSRLPASVPVRLTLAKSKVFTAELIKEKLSLLKQNRADDGRREVTWNHERNVSVSRENAVRVLP